MSLKINEDPVSTPASEWAEQTTSALGSSADNVSPYDASSPFGSRAASASAATTPGADLRVPGSFPISQSDEPVTMALPDVSQHVASAKAYISTVDVAQHVETARQYLPAPGDVQAAVAGVAQTVGQYLPAGVLDVTKELVGKGGHSTTPHDIDSDLKRTAADGAEPSIVPTEEPAREDAALLDPSSTAFVPETSPKLDANDEPLGHSAYSTVADTQNAARVPLPAPTTSFSQPTVDVANDAESGSPVVTVHPEASLPDESGPDVGRADELPSISRADAKGAQAAGVTTATAPIGLEKPVSIPLSGALSSPPAQPAPPALPHKDVEVLGSAGQDVESRSTSSDAAIPSMGSEDKLGDGDMSETGADRNPGREKKGTGGASKLLGKVKEKLKSGQKA